MLEFTDVVLLAILGRSLIDRVVSRVAISAQTV